MHLIGLHMKITLFPECVNAHTYITKRPLEMCKEGHNLLYVLRRRTIRIFTTSTLISVVSTIIELPTKKFYPIKLASSIVTKIGNIDLAALKALPY